jgi:hypothetical protein
MLNRIISLREKAVMGVKISRKNVNKKDKMAKIFSIQNFGT